MSYGDIDPNLDEVLDDIMKAADKTGVGGEMAIVAVLVELVAQLSRIADRLEADRPVRES